MHGHGRAAVLRKRAQQRLLIWGVYCIQPKTDRKKCLFHYPLKGWGRTPLGGLTDWMSRCLADGESPDLQLAFWMHVWSGGWLLLLLSSRLGSWLHGWLADWLTGPPSASKRTEQQNTHTQTQARTHLTFFLLFYALCTHQLPRVLLLMSALERSCSGYIHCQDHTHLRTNVTMITSDEEKSKSIIQMWYIFMLLCTQQSGLVSSDREQLAIHLAGIKREVQVFKQTSQIH